MAGIKRKSSDSGESSGVPKKIKIESMDSMDSMVIVVFYLM